MNQKARLSALIPALACLAAAHSLCAEVTPAPVALNSVRVWSAGPVTRIAIQTSGEVQFRRDHLPSPPRLFVDLRGCEIKLDKGNSRVMEVDDPLVERIRIALNNTTTVRIVFDLKKTVDYEISQLANPFRIMVELREKGAGPRPSPSDAGRVISQRLDTPPATAPTPASKPAEPRPEPVEVAKPKPAETRPAPVEVAKPKPAGPKPSRVEIPKPAPRETRPSPVEVAKAEPSRTEPTPPRVAIDPPRSVDLAAPPKPADVSSSRRTSLTRALGLKLNRVVIDPGHGGHDHGTTGPGGLKEKELVLDLAKRLKDLIEQRLGAEVILTRESDVFIPLEERTDIANRHRADLFLSIHLNSSRYRTVSGPEVFYLNFTDSKDDLEVASRENAGHGKSIFELTELLQKIALKDKIAESSEFARHVQRSLYRLNSPTAATKNRGVKKAPFVVLIGASMPSILAEVGFVTNAREEAQMKRPEFRDQMAEALYNGVAAYAATLSKLDVARESSTSAADAPAGEVKR
jgi:N-acetylmuramoyl-L-alanine amidase